MSVRCLAEAASIDSVGRPHGVLRNAHFLSVLQHIPDKNLYLTCVVGSGRLVCAFIPARHPCLVQLQNVHVPLSATQAMAPDMKIGSKLSPLCPLLWGHSQGRSA